MGGVCRTYGGEERCIQGFRWGNLKERHHLEDIGVNGRIILRWMLKKWNLGALTGSSWLRIGTGGGNL